jgi:ribosome-binding factor A
MKKNSVGTKTDGRRVSRVEKEIQSVVSTYIIQNLQSELPGLVTIGRVMVPADLRSAKIYVSMLNINSSSSNKTGKESEIAKTIKTLQSWAPDIQEAIDTKLKMKYLPKITFYEDESTEKILKIETLLSKINPKSETASESDEE